MRRLLSRILPPLPEARVRPASFPAVMECPGPQVFFECLCVVGDILRSGVLAAAGLLQNRLRGMDPGLQGMREALRRERIERRGGVPCGAPVLTGGQIQPVTVCRANAEVRLEPIAR